MTLDTGPNIVAVESPIGLMEETASGEAVSVQISRGYEYFETGPGGRFTSADGGKVYRHDSVSVRFFAGGCESASTFVAPA